MNEDLDWYLQGWCIIRGQSLSRGIMAIKCTMQKQNGDHHMGDFVGKLLVATCW
jgi:hypothetical protein